MRNQIIFAKGAAFFLLLVLATVGAQARAQNQTPANIALVGWTDPDTGLTWTKQDNGSDVNWNQAITYCTNLRLGGYIDWRLPTIDELQGIYDSSIDVPARDVYGNEAIWHVKGNLKLTCSFQWSSSQGSSPRTAKYFYFSSGGRGSSVLSDSNRDRALCVRR
jgi:hypothetical protein